LGPFNHFEWPFFCAVDAAGSPGIDALAAQPAAKRSSGTPRLFGSATPFTSCPEGAFPFIP